MSGERKVYVIDDDVAMRDSLNFLLDAAGIANGAVNEVADVAVHPQLAARGRWSRVDSPAGPIPALLPPHNLAHTFDGTPWSEASKVCAEPRHTLAHL